MEKIKWRSRRPDIEARAAEIYEPDREHFMQVMESLGLTEMVVCDELGVQVAKGQEWRVEQLIEKYGRK